MTEMPKMNILMLSWEYPPHVVGGLAAHAQGLARALVERGNKVTVLTQDAATPQVDDDHGVRVIRIGAIPVRSPDFMGYVHQLNQLLLAKAVELIQQGETFDIIHAHDWIVAFAASGLKQALRRPLVATIHATEHGRNGGLHNDQQRHISDIEWWLIYEAWRVIVCSRAMHEELQSVFQAPADKVQVVPNGIDISDMHVEADQTLRRQYATDDEELIVFVGRLVFEKGVDTLLYALKQLSTVRPKVKVIIAGRGAIQEDLQQLAHRLGVADRVHFVGHVDAKTRDRLYAISNVAAFPSRYEPFGIVALEAMAADLPVVVGNVGGLREIITDGEDGFLVQPGNAGALSAALLTMLDDKERTKRMVEKAKEKVMNVFTWHAVAEQTEQVYNRVRMEYETSGWAQSVTTMTGKENIRVKTNDENVRVADGRYQSDRRRNIFANR